MDKGHWSGRVQVLRLAGDECVEREKKNLGRKKLEGPSETVAMLSLLTSRKGNAKNWGRSFSEHGPSAGHQDRELGARVENECSLACVPSSCTRDERTEPKGANPESIFTK